MGSSSPLFKPLHRLSPSGRIGGESVLAEAPTGGDDGEEGGRTKRELLRGELLALSIAVPIAFVAYADHVRQSTAISWVAALGVLVAASLVIPITAIARR